MKHKTSFASSWCLVVASFLFPPIGAAQESAKPTSPELVFNPRTVIPRALPAIVNAPAIRADQIGDKVLDDEL